ncbi:cell wall hydrolase [Halalkalibacter sp. APA_J-10(15)]|uniref:cell wall hydrolase n=1 Tax=unclassified Halalkalibacter TaxID=2893063 RepID=UPI001FF24FA7|nr:cell wall hydrolase [Halalkalibacter sp. APA_J-10(15)]MCK0472637.1 cell wall hydrolase [Halalkalibacter sp. APA_J-10(15)]
MKKIIMTVCATAMIFIGAQGVQAQTTHEVVSGDTLYLLGQKYGVSVHDIKKSNSKQSDVIYIGEHLQIPNSISSTERDLLARLVHAEAQGEPYSGKVAVATVVLNRVDHDDFPNSIYNVIHEVAPSGHYAFSPVQNGHINRSADDEAKRAVDEALAFRGQGAGSLFFYNPDIATNHWIATRTETTRIGNHVFAK